MIVIVAPLGPVDPVDAEMTVVPPSASSSLHHRTLPLRPCCRLPECMSSLFMPRRLDASPLET